MSFKTGSKVILRSNAADMDLGYDIDQIESGKVYEVAVKKGDIALLITGENFFDRIAIEIKALEWA